MTNNNSWRFSKEDIAMKLTWLHDIKISNSDYLVAYGAAMVMHDLKDNTADIDIIINIMTYMKIIFLSFFNSKYKIPDGIEIIPNVLRFIPGATEGEYVAGYRVQTLRAIRTVKKYRNRIGDETDIKLINEAILNDILGSDEHPTFKFAHLVGSTRNNQDLFRSVEKELTLRGYICYVPVLYKLEEYLENKEMIDDMCYQKLLHSDICVIVTPDHIGRSTTMMIYQCREILNIPVYKFIHGKLIELTNYEFMEIIEGVDIE